MKKHDQNELTQRAVEAKAAGLSYGQYMAKLYDLHSLTGKIEKKAENDPSEEEEGPKYYCVVCGKMLPNRDNRRRKYCSVECSYLAEKRREMLRKSENCNKED